MDRKYRVVSRAILATAMIVPAFIATKVAAENRGWNTSSYRSNYYNYAYNNWNSYNGYNPWTYSYGYGYPIGTIIMVITMVILAGIIIMAIMVGTMAIP